MWRKASICGVGVIMTVMALLFSASVAMSFWYGDKASLYANLGDGAKADFAACLVDEVFPYLDTDLDQAALLADWYGNLDLMLAELSPDGKASLNQCLKTYVLPELDLALNDDNRGDDEGVTVYNRRKAFDGYTLLSSIMGHGCDQPPPAGSPPFPVFDAGGNLVASNTCGAVLIDMDGNIVKEWPLIAVPAKMLPEGNVLGMAIAPNGPPVNGIQAMMQMDWCGNETWRWPDSPYPVFPILGGARVHHDFQREGNPVGYFSPGQAPSLTGGKNLVLSNINSTPFVPPLFVPEVSSHELAEDALYEVGINGEIAWAWYPYEHVEQMGFGPAARDAIREIRVMGIGGVPEGDGPTDWQHINTASYLGPNKWFNLLEPETWIFHPDNIIYDSRTANYLAIIARVAHPQGKWNIGDIVWRVGPNYSADDPEGKLGQIIGPHMAHMIPQGLPGEGNILVFDNGGVAGYGSLLPGLPGTYPATFRDFSRVVEFNPITKQIVWEYRCEETKQGARTPLERKFYSRLISGAQRLKNGNTLITEGISGRVFEVTRRKALVWEYIHKASYANGALPLLGFLPSTAIYRAYRVPKSWVPIGEECTE